MKCQRQNIRKTPETQGFRRFLQVENRGFEPVLILLKKPQTQGFPYFIAIFIGIFNYPISSRQVFFPITPSGFSLYAF